MTTAVVVGSGPNGLAAALTLAEAGVEVTVLETASRIGGGTRSSELTLPGLIHDECSGFHPRSQDTRFACLAKLEHHGQGWAGPKDQYSHPTGGDAGGAAVRSIADSADGLIATSEHGGWSSVRWSHASAHHRRPGRCDSEPVPQLAAQLSARPGRQPRVAKLGPRCLGSLRGWTRGVEHDRRLPHGITVEASSSCCRSSEYAVLHSIRS